MYIAESIPRIFVTALTESLSASSMAASRDQPAGVYI